MAVAARRNDGCVRSALDPAQQRVIGAVEHLLHRPAQRSEVFGATEEIAPRRQQIAARRFLATWRRAGSWGIVALRPGELPRAVDARRYLEASNGLEAAGRTAAAALSYAAATARWPQEPLGWFGLANVRLTEGRFADAEAGYRQALALDPARPAARNNLALLLARRGCADAARAEIGRARADAGGTPFAAEVAASEAEIGALRATAGTPSADCPR